MSDVNSAGPAQPPLVIEQIKRSIRARIGTMWRIGDRLPPINEMARDMGVGEKNAYRAVRELAEEGLLASRPRHGTFVADRPTPKPTRKRKRHVTQMLMAPDRDGMIQRMGRAFYDEMRRRGLTVKIDDETPTLTRDLDLRGIDADAVVLFNPAYRHIHVDDPGPVFAVIDTSCRPPAGLSQRYDLVGPDNAQGGLLAGQFLKQFDLTDVGYVGMADAQTGAYKSLDEARLGGFERGFGQTLPASRRFTVYSYSEQDGAKFARQYAAMKDRPQAMFLATDDIAAGFVIGCVALGLVHREHYHIVGFDGQSRGQSVVYGGLTTVAVPAEAMGRQAAEFLEMRLEHPDLPPRSISLGCTIRRGKTSPEPTHPNHPFFAKDARYWPAAPRKGHTP